jgi:branched-chain amino acid transport system substrate-binding protein
MTGIVFSNVMLAVWPTIQQAKVFYVAPNSTPTLITGKGCSPYFFSASWPNEAHHEAAGEFANSRGFKNAFLIAPNYPAGKDALTGFKRMFKGEIAGEVYTRLDQTDFAPEMAQIRAANPDVVFQFHPGGLGIAFLRQYQQAGLLGTIPMVLAEPSLDATTLKAVGESALGLNVTAHWNSDFDNAANKKFMEAWTKAYNRAPTYYASQGYDAALAIASALKATSGKTDVPALRTALAKADFQSVRGAFKFGPNQHPVQDWYSLKVEKGADGTPVLKTTGKVLSNHGDVYAKDCKL